MKRLLLLTAVLLLAPSLSADIVPMCIAPLVAHVRKPLMGIASYYGDGWEGKTMANGKPFNKHKLTAASYDIPLGKHIKVRNMENDRVIEVVITDRGPNHRLHRLIDISEAGADRLGYKHQGLTLVSIEE